jgi:hypothetical protein
VLAGLASSVGALIAVLLIAWGNCGGGSGEDCDVELAVASLAAVPALLLVAAVLLLLASRAATRFLNDLLVVLALFVGLLPLAMLSRQEWWSLLLFALLLSGLVVNLVVPHEEELPAPASRPRTPGAAQSAAPSNSYGEALEEMLYWAEEVKVKAADLSRAVHALGRR